MMNFSIEPNLNVHQFFSGSKVDNPIGQIKHFRLQRVSTGLIPPGLYYMSPDRKIVSFLRPPERKTITYHGALQQDITSETPSEDFDIWMPWTMYTVIGSGTHINYVYIHGVTVEAVAHHFGDSSDSYQTLLDSAFFSIPLTNVYADSRFCIPTFHELTYSSVAEMINAAYDVIWNSTFNRDVTAMVELFFVDRRNYPSLSNGMDQQIFDRKSPADLYSHWSKKSLEEILYSKWLRHPDTAHLNELHHSMDTTGAYNFYMEIYSQMKQ